MANSPNQDIHECLEKMGNPSLTLVCSKSKDDEECEEDEAEVTSQRAFGAII